MGASMLQILKSNILIISSTVWRKYQELKKIPTISINLEKIHKINS